MKYGSSTVPPATIDSGEAFPPSRHIFPSVAPSVAPRQTSNGLKQRLSAATTAAATADDQQKSALPVDSQQQQPRYRVSSRFSGARKSTLPKEDPPQAIQSESKPTARPFRLRPKQIKTTYKPLVDPIDDSRFNSEPGQPLLQRSISSQNAKPVNQFALRKTQLKVNGGRTTTTTTERPEESNNSSPGKPTRRTFTRKPSVASTTPANLRVTKRYYKTKNGLKVETTTSYSAVPAHSTTEASIKPFRVATRHQKPLKTKNQTLKTLKKYDDGVEEGENYPEHFKLLLKNQPESDKVTKAKSSLTTKAFRTSPRIDIDSPQSEKAVLHAALRNKPKPRPLLKVVSSTTPTTTTSTTTTEAPITRNPYAEEGQLNLIEDEEVIPIRSQELFSATSREGRTQLDRGVPSRNSRVGSSTHKAFESLQRIGDDDD